MFFFFFWVKKEHLTYHVEKHLSLRNNVFILNNYETMTVKLLHFYIKKDTTVKV